VQQSSSREQFRDVIALAPMATGGNLPYRRLCRDYGADVTCSEMVVAAKLVRGGERPLLRHHETERFFGIQLCGNAADQLADGARIAVEHGARFVDLNFGCPIDVIVRRGCGAALMKRPRKLAGLVEAVRAAVEVPVTVKIRSGWSDRKLNAVEVAGLVAAAGADAICVHGRTRAQRYRRSADWSLIDAVARSVTIPVLGNGDVLTPWDLERRRRETTVASVSVGRGALIKPWVFQELQENRTLTMPAPARWRVMRRYYDYATEYFGDDAKGQARVQRFFLWHLDFWHRHRAYTEADFQAALPGSLIQTREPQVAGDADEVLLASADPSDHETIWQRVVDRDFP